MTRYYQILTLSMILLLAPSASANRFLEGLFSPLGGIVIATIANFGLGVGNFIGGFRWDRRAGLSSERSLEIQESGWLLCSAISFVLTGAVPLWAYFYSLRHPQQNPYTETIEVR